MKCPICQSRETFLVSMSGMGEVNGEDELVDKPEDFDWDDDSACVCRSCKHNGTVNEFEDD